MGDSVSFVVIGHNEANNLARCLESIRAQEWRGRTEILYVDSRSTDASRQIAARFEGVVVLELGDAEPNAAKGRNLGWSRATGELVQFVDGDAVLDPGWTQHAAAALRDPRVAAVCGQLDELYPERSLYNRLADLDWPRQPGDVEFFGGIVMVRRRCLAEAGGFPETALSGEEPLLALELRRLGYRLVQLPVPMALHDLDTHDFGTYWRRCVQTGVSLAEQVRAKRMLGAPWHSLRTTKNVAAAAAALAAAALGLWLGPWVWLAAAAALLADIGRIAWRIRGRARSPGVALAYALHVRLLVAAQLVGLLRWARRRARTGGSHCALEPRSRPAAMKP